MPLPINPYIAGNPVGTTNAFIGRDDVLREVLRVLRNPNQNAITLFGQRRIGKTSVLENLVELLPKEGKYHPVYFDLQDKAAWSVQKVIIILARTIAESLDIEPLDPKASKHDFKKTWLPNALAQLPKKTSLVLLFDEFDVLADPKSPQAAEGFFPYLRELLDLDLERLQFIFVLGRNLSDLNQLALSLFKGVNDKRVSLLTKKDTLKLAQLSEENDTLAWSEKALNHIWGLTSGHPFLTQALASQVWENAYEDESDDVPQIEPKMVDDAILTTLESSRNTLRWLWDGLGPAEKVVASALSQAGDKIVTYTDLERILRESGVRILIRELQHAPQLLEDWDILEEADGGYGFKVELLRRWIVENKPLSRVQEELDYIQPVAENMFQAANGLYGAGELDNAESQLKQAIGLNPNHVRANELLAEILISQDRLDEAQDLLEKLLDISPSIARSRLVQVCLLQAEKEPEDEKRLALWEKVISLELNNGEANKGRDAILEKRKLISDFHKGLRALKNSRWKDAEEALKWVVHTYPAYRSNGVFAVDLLAATVRKKKALPPIWRIWPHDEESRTILHGLVALAFVIFTLMISWLIFQQGVKNRIGPFGIYAPTYTSSPTPTNTPTLPPTMTKTLTPTSSITPTLTPTAPNTQTPVYTSTLTLTPTVTSTPTPEKGDAITRHIDRAIMYYVPEGVFYMGSENGEADEHPVHKVYLDAFWIDRTEVTNAMYTLCVSSGNCNLPTNTKYYNDGKYQQHPVIYVSWYEAQAYCEWVDATLPTEAQWEKAARGEVEGLLYPWGDVYPLCSANEGAAGAKFDNNSTCNDTGTEQVASFYPNDYGLYDMVGNVSEWIADWYNNSYYQNSPIDLPLGAGKGHLRVIRGGSWTSNNYFLRVASRSFGGPSASDAYIGFRCSHQLIRLP